MKRLQVLLFALLSTTALARGPDGTLALIQTPNNGIPVIVKPGTRFEALVTEKTTSLKLEGPKTIPLDATWTPLPGGKMRATCTVPADAPIGTYALEAVAGDRTDSNSRSVFVRESFPKTYVVAHPTDTHIGSNRNPRKSDAIFSDVITAVNGSDAAFVVITGDLTENGNADQFRSFLKALDRCRLPTYVCAGNHDRQGLNYEQFFGPDTYMFWFGEDGYISFDTKDRIRVRPSRALPQVFLFPADIVSERASCGGVVVVSTNEARPCCIIGRPWRVSKWEHESFPCRPGFPSRHKHSQTFHPARRTELRHSQRSQRAEWTACHSLSRADKLLRP